MKIYNVMQYQREGRRLRYKFLLRKKVLLGENIFVFIINANSTIYFSVFEIFLLLKLHKKNILLA